MTDLDVSKDKCILTLEQAKIIICTLAIDIRFAWYCNDTRAQIIYNLACEHELNDVIEFFDAYNDKFELTYDGRYIRSMPLYNYVNILTLAELRAAVGDKVYNEYEHHYQYYR